jgi:hypothetical protein
MKKLLQEASRRDLDPLHSLLGGTASNAIARGLYHKVPQDNRTGCCSGALKAPYQLVRNQIA